MDFKIGIIGLPNSGKTTLLKKIAFEIGNLEFSNSLEISPYPFTTIKPNILNVSFRDQRSNQIKIAHPFENFYPERITFIDSAAIVQNSCKGEGIGNSFLNHLRNSKFLIQTIKNDIDDEDENSLHTQEELIAEELRIADKDYLESIKSEIEQSNDNVLYLENTSQNLGKRDLLPLITEMIKFLKENITPDIEALVKKHSAIRKSMDPDFLEKNKIFLLSTKYKKNIFFDDIFFHEDSFLSRVKAEFNQIGVGVFFIKSFKDKNLYSYFFQKGSILKNVLETIHPDLLKSSEKSYQIFGHEARTDYKASPQPLYLNSKIEDGDLLELR